MKKTKNLLTIVGITTLIILSGCHSNISATVNTSSEQTVAEPLNTQESQQTNLSNTNNVGLTPDTAALEKSVLAKASAIYSPEELAIFQSQLAAARSQPGYQKALTALDQSLNDLASAVNNSPTQISVQGVKRVQLNPALQASSPAITSTQQTEELQSERDAARKADLNNIIATVETYNAYNNKYPQTSGCVESQTELNQYYFPANKLPQDPQGPQKFGNITCASGYYYLIIPNKEYDVWAKMEIPTDGNIDVTPNVYATNPDIYKPARKTTATIMNGGEVTTSTPVNPPSGTYYFESKNIA